MTISELQSNECKPYFAKTFTTRERVQV